ncbi:Secreted protein [Plasmodiophora brassicae]|uniref:Secreted protein n=1 Tax=Plasmodiophora brassicae TaxID=37360 RepID=A0A0G4ITZ4_PLABS|nr:hypothetical protein PBRA_006849 [Plasmodiophora brassicae]SPR00631.1 unnamed protein product [Plasmodiophora brassicae]
MRVALAVLLPLIVVCNPGTRCDTRGNVGGPADRRAGISDAVVLLEAARSSLCEADLTVLDVGRSFGTDRLQRVPRPSGDRSANNRASRQPIRHGPNAPAFTTVFRLLEQRLIKNVLSSTREISRVHSWADGILNDPERQTVAPPRHDHHVSRDRFDKLVSIVRSLGTDHMLRFGRDLHTRNDFAIRDANFVDLPVQRFWNVARVSVDDLMNAISETANQISASRLMLHQLIVDRLILYDMYTRILDLASSVCSLAEDAVAADTERMSPTKATKMVSPLRTLIGRVHLLIGQVECMGVLYNDALEHLEQADKHIQQSLELLSVEARGSVVSRMGNSPVDRGEDATVLPEVLDEIAQAFTNPSPAVPGLIAGMPQSATTAKELLACVVCTDGRRTPMETSRTVTIVDDCC